ncbi:hypothetical protein ACYX34_13920 [Nitrospira sp. CMX1]
MDVDKFLNLLAAVFGALGSIYVLKGVAALSPNLIERLSRTYWDFSSAQIDALTAQKADSIIGIVLVLIALAITVANLTFVPEGMRMFERRTVGIALVLGLTGLAYIALVFSGDALQRHDKLTVSRIITRGELEDLFKSGKVPASQVTSLKVLARTLFTMSVDDSETPRSLVNRLANEVGVQVPPSLDFSEVEKKPDKQ